MSDLRTSLVATGVRIEVRVTTRASRSEIAGTRDGRLLVRLAAPPVDGKANEALIKLLATSLRIAQSDIRIVRGMASRTKVLDIVAEAAEIHRLAAPQR